MNNPSLSHVDILSKQPINIFFLMNSALLAVTNSFVYTTTGDAEGNSSAKLNLLLP